MLQESGNINAESYIEDASNDLSENVDNTVLGGCDTKRNVDMSFKKTKQDDFQQAENTFVLDSPLSNHIQENVSEVKSTVVPETDEETPPLHDPPHPYMIHPTPPWPTSPTMTHPTQPHPTLPTPPHPWNIFGKNIPGIHGVHHYVSLSVDNNEIT